MITGLEGPWVAGKIDLLVAIYLLLGLRKGHRRGLGRELQALVNLLLLLAILVGLWVSRWLREALSGAMHLIPATSGVLGGLLAFLGALWLMRLLRRRLGDMVEARVGPGAVRIGGGALGLARALVVAVAVLAILAQAPFAAVREPVAQGSLTGHAAAWIGSRLAGGTGP